MLKRAYEGFLPHFNSGFLHPLPELPDPPHQDSRTWGELDIDIDVDIGINVNVNVGVGVVDIELGKGNKEAKTGWHWKEKISTKNLLWCSWAMVVAQWLSQRVVIQRLWVWIALGAGLLFSSSFLYDAFRWVNTIFQTGATSTRQKPTRQKSIRQMNIKGVNSSKDQLVKWSIRQK